MRRVAPGLSTALAATAVLAGAAMAQGSQPPRPGANWAQQYAAASLRHCTEYLRQNGTFWGDPGNTAWQPASIDWLCDVNEGFTERPPQAVACFSTNLAAGLNWQEAVIACRHVAGKQAGNPADPSTWGVDRAHWRSRRNSSGTTLGCDPAMSVPPRIAFSRQLAPVAVAITNNLAIPVDVCVLDSTGANRYRGSVQPSGSMQVLAPPTSRILYGIGGAPSDPVTVGTDPAQTVAIGAQLGPGQYHVSGATPLAPAQAPGTNSPARPSGLPVPSQPPSVAANVTVTLQNPHDRPIDVYAVDEAGQPQFLVTLQAGNQIAYTAQTGTEFAFGVDGQEIAAYVTHGQPVQTYSIGAHSQPPSAPAFPPVSAPETAPVSAPVSAPAGGADDPYDFVIAFNSRGSGIDGRGSAIIADWLDTNAHRITYERVPWGREGELEYCANVNPGFAGQRAQITAELRQAMLGKRAKLSQNAPCRAKTLAEQRRRNSRF